MSRRSGWVRNVILRPLAGLVAVGCVFLLFTTDNMPLQRGVMTGILAVAFALYAVGGVEIAEHWLATWFGGLSSESRRQ